jgi:hypothetical protein
MTPEQAVTEVNGMVFKPGWRVTAERFGPRKVLVTMYIDTVDTSYPGEDGQCRKNVQLYRERIFDPAQMDLEAVCYQVLVLAAQTDVHEDREFLKVRRADGSWYAPLHPHTPQGTRAWLNNLMNDETAHNVLV